MSAVAASSLSCQHCGAPLTVGPRARFVTCTHCGSRLSVHRSDSAAWTETLEDVAAATGRIEAKLDALHRRPQLEFLERDWATIRRQLGRRSPAGGYRAPLAIDAVDEARGYRILGIVAGPLILLWTAFISLDVTSALFGLAGAVAATGGAWLWASHVEKSATDRVRRYEAAERNYRRRRAELLGEPSVPDA